MRSNLKLPRRFPRAIARLVLILAFAFALAAWSARASADPIITEFVADNDGALLDEDGEPSDWIEIYNPTAEAVGLLDWALSDNPGNIAKWRFPEVMLGPGEYLVVFASGKARAVGGGEFHTNFKLASEGESLILASPDGASLASVFAPYPRQRSGFSFGPGRRTLDPPLVEPGSEARYLVPTNGTLGSTWTGRNEPFDDGAGSGWTDATLGLGYPGAGGPPPPFPIAYYAFEGNAQDDAGGLRHGGLRGGALFSTDIPSKLAPGGRSLRLDGIDDYMSAPIDVSETAYTLSLWFKTSASGRGIFTVVGGELGANGHDRHLFLTGTNIASRVWQDETIASAGKSYANGQWHHAAHVFGGTTGGQRIYVDGLLAASGSKAESNFDWQESIHVGFSNNAAQPYFQGWIDDVALWDSALSQDQIVALAAGAHPLALAGYAPWISTDIETALRGVNGSIYVRIPFDIPAPLDVDSIILDLRYDDGCIAYLNGTEVARRNAPVSAGFDARALSNRPEGAAIVYERIDLGPFVGLLGGGRNILAIHGLNDTAAGADFLLEARLLEADAEEDRYHSPPTPGKPNGSGVIDFVADTSFSVDRGFFNGPFDVDVTTMTPGAEVWCTIDGTAPSPENPTAFRPAGSVRIATTTSLRAAAFKADHEPTDVDTQTYVFPAHVARQPAAPAGFATTWAGGYAADYGVDARVVDTALPDYGFEDALRSLPAISIVTDPEDLFGAARGIYSNSQGRGRGWERTASMEMFRPDGSKAFQADCGIRMHGNSSRDHGFTPKHPMRLLFRAEHGPTRLREDVFEDSSADSFDELLLRGCSTDSWPVVDGGAVLGVQRWAAVHGTYLRDQWMRDAQLALGQPSAHGTYAHLFLDGLYWGLYNLAERPVDSFCANYLGGEKEEYDVFKDFAELDAGNAEAWSAMLSQAAAGLSTTASYMRIQGRNPDGSRNPSYPVYLDVENLMDYMILHIASGAEDWPHHNWWGGRRRGAESTGFKFFVWDQEISNDSLVRTHTLFETRFEDPVSCPSPSYLYGQCMANASFRRDFGDRVHRYLFQGGVLSPEANAERWLVRETEIDRAIVGESARWGDARRAAPFKRETTWLAEMDWMRDSYWPQIQPIAVERFRRVGLYPEVDPPEFRIDGRPQHGGEFEPGASLSLRVAVVPRIVELSLVAADAEVAAFVPADASLGEAWRAAGYAEGSHGETWRHGTNGVGFETSTGYESAIHIDTRAEMSGAAGNNSVYVRIPFSVPDAATLARLVGLRLRVLYDDGFAAYLNGSRFAEVNAPAESAIEWNSAATAAGVEAVLASPSIVEVPSAVSLLRVGANVLAIQAFNASNLSSDMLILAELVGLAEEEEAPAGSIVYTLDGTDPTAPGAVAYSGPIPLEHTTRVKARAKDGAVWSALTEAVFVNPADLPLRISEIHYHPAPDPGVPPASGGTDPDEYEFLEFVNAGPTPIALDGVVLEGGVSFDFRDAEVSSLAPGARLLLVEDPEAFISRYGLEGFILAGKYTGRLSNAGERLILRGPLGEALLDFRYDPAWSAETLGGGPSLAIADEDAPPSTWSLPESWTASVWIGGSPGSPEPGSPTGGIQFPGDSNQDGLLDLSDAVSLLFRLFGGDPNPPPCGGESILEGGNVPLLDATGDGRVDITDPIHILSYLFRGGPPHALGPRCTRIEGCPHACRN